MQSRTTLQKSDTSPEPMTSLVDNVDAMQMLAKASPEPPKKKRMKRKTSSDVWENFTKYSNEKSSLRWKYIKCTAMSSIQSSTGITRAHINNHGYLFKNSKQKCFMKSGAIVDVMQILLAEQQENLERLVVKRVVIRMKTFSSVEAECFKLMMLRGAKLQIKSGHTIRIRILEEV